MSPFAATAIPRILFIDDSDDDILLAVNALGRDGMEFGREVASSLRDAERALERGGWSLILCDYNLGTNTGLEVLAIARRTCPDIPFVLLSGTIGEERAVEAIRMGAADYVMKDRLGRLPATVRREIQAADARRARVALETRLRGAEERYRKTVERAPIGIVSADPSGHYISVNARFCEILGYSETELLGHHFSEFSFDADTPIAQAVLDSLVNGSEASTYFQRRYVRKNGELAWTAVTVASVRDAQDELEYVIGLVEDITDRRKAHEKLLVQARLLDCVEQSVLATDLNGSLVYWNSFAESLYGWSAAETIGQNINDFVCSDELRVRTTKLLERVKLGESSSGELTMLRRDGSGFPALVMNSPIFDEQQSVIGMVSVSHDLTRQKRVENELRQHRVQLAVAQDIARIGSWSYDFGTGERQCSDALLRLLGLEPGTTLEIEDLLALVHPDDQAGLAASCERAHETFEASTANFRMRLAAGERDILLRYSFETTADGKPVKAIGVIQDVTESRRLETELLRRTTQQSAVANLGQLALSGASNSAVLDQAVGVMQTILELDRACVMQNDGDGRSLASGHHCPDIESATHGLSVPIPYVDGTEWGVLGGSWKSPRPVAAYDLEFVRSIASILGQAADRAAADRALRTLAQRQSAIAALGKTVLKSVGDEVFSRACELLKIGTGADFAFVAERTDDAVTHRAGLYWADSLPTRIPLEARTQIAETVRRGAPVVVADYRDNEFPATSAVTFPHGVLSGAMVPVAGATTTYGVLSVQSRRAGAFRGGDVEFMQSLANMLAEAMERESARGRVAESEERYRRIFDGATEIIFSIDPAGRFTSLNPAFETITGFARSQFLGSHFLEVIVPEDRKRIVDIFHEMIASECGASASLSLIGRDGPIIVEVSLFARTEQDAVREVYGFARDVNDARRVEAERERVTRSLQLLLESTVEGIYTVDLAGRCTMVNRGAAAFLGMQADEILGSSIHDVLHARSEDGTPRSTHDCPIHAVLRDGEPRTITRDVFSRKDGVTLPVAYSAAPIIDDGRRVGAVVTFTDLTAHQKLEAKLEQANRLTSLGRLAATVAHEFNNVLMGIAPFVEVLRRSPSQQKVTSALDHIASAVRRGRRITEDILRFTQPAEPVRAAVEVDGWLRSISVEARSFLGESFGLLVEADPLWIEADANQLHQIFMNLILNARDAMPHGGVISLCARREAEDAKFPFGAVENPARYAHLTASDTGCGMSEETLRHAFEPLFTTKRSGTGLGLAVTHQVVLRHGGEIFIESVQGVGTTFHIFLPLAAPPVDVIAEPAGEQPQEAHAREILLVEDNATVAIGLTALLEAEGYAVRCVETGGAALQAVAGALPDAVVLDVGLPDMDGRAVFAEIAANHPALPVIFSTGHTDRGGLEELLTRPNLGYLRKPYEGSALMEALHAVMNASG